jgi:hypothetical protein
MSLSCLLEIDLETLRPVALALRLASGRTVRALFDEASAEALSQELALAPRAEAAVAAPNRQAPRAVSTDGEVPSL